MKRKIFTLFFIITLIGDVYSQFPAPTNFERVDVYAGPGQDAYSNCGILSGPDWCLEYSWNAPDLSGITSTLDHYNIYYNEGYASVIKLAETTDNSYNDKTGFVGNCWVTASYINPSGESMPSNTVNSGGVPVSVKKVYNDILSLLINKNGLLVKVKNKETFSAIKIYCINGMLVKEVLHPSNNEIILFPNQGVYVLKMITSKGEIITKKIIL